ncbi:sugar phosphate isomerase/epimerase family protein [Gracilibacillus suaedae]|uniref:sugar phosphate isomerase/epimerase family protein n=1 Tax=Gracilibacillus suaedae TaxID=2820273 RepID=UPI001ABDD46A|nr:sugar phosphate isomerase/epimerase family protein [Gracilibacillus suaedae]
MQLYMSSTLCWNFSVSKAMQIAEANGIDGVEVWVDQLNYHNTSCKEINKIRQYTDLELSIHAPSWDLNLCSLNKSIQQSSMEEMERAMHIGAEIGAPNITIHPGRATMSVKNKASFMQTLKENIYVLAEKGSSLGIDLSIELMEERPKELITTPSAMNQLVEELPDNVQVTFDVAHVPLAIDPIQYYQALSRVNKIHLSDSTSSTYHVALGEGEILLPSILAEIQDLDCPVVLEGLDQTYSLQLLQKHLHYLQSNRLRRKDIANLSYK